MFIKQRNITKQKALSLLEVLTVLIIIGIISLVVVKNLSPTVVKVKAKEAEYQLKFIHTLQQTHFMEFSKYSSEFKELGYDNRTLVTEGGDANYRIEIVESSVSGFKARATSVVDFDQDGAMDTWEIDQQGKLQNIVPD
jgi:type IV pilus assembly protein PilE